MSINRRPTHAGICRFYMLILSVADQEGRYPRMVQSID